MTIYHYQGDLPADVDFGAAIAIDTEAMGLDMRRDRLCLVQISTGDGNAHLVQIAQAPAGEEAGGQAHIRARAPRLAALLENPDCLKIFHFARFDVAALLHNLDILCRPIYCTKIASKLVRTYTDRHGLKDLVKDLLGIELSKQQQTSDWGAETLSEEQMRYAAADVLHLHKLKEKLDFLLAREGRRDLAEACFRFLPDRARLDLLGWEEPDIFAH